MAKAQTVLRLDVEVTDGMAREQIREWAEFLRHDLEKVNMCSHDSEFSVVRCVVEQPEESVTDVIGPSGEVVREDDVEVDEHGVSHRVPRPMRFEMY